MCVFVGQAKENQKPVEQVRLKETVQRRNVEIFA